jgi:ABC-type branched-subunit amino acid transport system permease subunit
VIGTQFFFFKDYMFGLGVVETRRPEVWGLDSNDRYFYLLLAVGVLAVVAVMMIERSRLGRLLRGMADAPVALSTLGLSVNVSRVLVFCIAGFMAGISGGLYASMFGGVSRTDFIYVNSLVVLAVMAISGRSTVQVAVVAPVLLYVLPNYVTGEHVSTILQMCFGLAAIAAAIGSQGAYERWAASTAARFRDRLTGPASVRLADYRGRHGRQPASVPR